MGKTILYLLLIIMFSTSLSNVLVNVINLNKEPFKGIVFKTEEQNAYADQNIPIRVFYIKKNDIIYEGSYPLEKKFNIKVGDTITYKKTYLISNENVRIIKKNNKTLQSNYGPYDFITIFITVAMILGYFYLPKYIKTLKNKHNEELFKHYNN